MADELLVPLHVAYIQNLGKVDTPASPRCRLTLPQSTDELAYHLTAHLRMNGIYWGLTALCIMGHQDALDRDQMVDFVMRCWDDEAGLFRPCPIVLQPHAISLGAFGAHPDHDAHILSTLSAIQIMIMQDALDRVDVDRVVKCETVGSLIWYLTSVG